VDFCTFLSSLSSRGGDSAGSTGEANLVGVDRFRIVPTFLFKGLPLSTGIYSLRSRVGPKAEGFDIQSMELFCIRFFLFLLYRSSLPTLAYLIECLAQGKA
jgi:hypothetical protein